MSERSKYDAILSWAPGGEGIDVESFGLMVDRSIPRAVVEQADPDPALANVSSSPSAAGVYDWKDQRQMPGVSISDFRGGQGQKTLDRSDSLENAFLRGRFLNCEIEGEVGVAPSLLSFEHERIESAVASALGRIWATFDPIVAEGQAPETVRWLERYEVVLSESVLDVDTIFPFDDESSIAVGDYLYDPFWREGVRVSSIAPVTVVRGSDAMVKVDDVVLDPCDHEAGAVFYGYGWRVAEFDETDLDTADVPVSHCTSLTGDGQYLWAAFSDSNADGELWRYDLTSDKLCLPEHAAVTGIDGIRHIVYGLGVLYYATDTEAGWIGRANLTDEELGAHPLTAKAVIGETWTTDRWEKDETMLLAPLVGSQGLRMEGTWCYWLVSSNKSTTLYRIQSPVGFELVYNSFPSSFVGTCIESGFGNVYVGGYCITPDGDYEGAIYLFNGDTSSRLLTFDEYEEATDNRVKGITTVGRTLKIMTNSAVYTYLPSSGGYWHTHAVKPSDGVVNPHIIPPEAWDGITRLDAAPNLAPKGAPDGDWVIRSTSATAPTIDTKERTTGPHDSQSVETNLEVLGKNGRFRKWTYSKPITGKKVSLQLSLGNVLRGYYWKGLPLPDDGHLGAGKRRMAEVSLSNGLYEARMRLIAYKLSPREWTLQIQTANWSPTYKTWNFTKRKFNCSHMYAWEILFSLDETGCSVSRGRRDVAVPLSPLPTLSVAAKSLMKVPLDEYEHVVAPEVWWSAGIHVGDAIVYNKDKNKWVNESSTVNTSEDFYVNLHQVAIMFDVPALPPLTLNSPDGMGDMAELDGEVFFPCASDFGSGVKGVLNLTRRGETYAGPDAFIETSDSYQGLGTSKKFYRRFEVAFSTLDEYQALSAVSFVDGSVAGQELQATAATGSPGFGSQLAMQQINQSGTKAHCMVALYDANHLRNRTDRLRVNSIGLRFMTAGSPVKRAYTFILGDYVECRDRSLWDYDPGEVLDFIRRMKTSGVILKLVTDENEDGYDCYIDEYSFDAAVKDEEATSILQGVLQIVLKMIDD